MLVRVYSSLRGKALRVSHLVAATLVGYRVELVAHGYTHRAVSYPEAVAWAAAYGLNWGSVAITKHWRLVGARGHLSEMVTEQYQENQQRQYEYACMSVAFLALLVVSLLT